MTQKILTFYSCQNLCVEGDLPQEMVIEVPFEKVRPKACTESEEETTFPFTTLSGNLVFKCQRGCGSLVSYEYQFQYDSEDVIENYDLKGGDVQGFALKGALGKYAEDLAGNACYVYTNDDGDVVFVNQFGCEYTIIEGP